MLSTQQKQILCKFWRGKYWDENTFRGSLDRFLRDIRTNNDRYYGSVATMIQAHIDVCIRWFNSENKQNPIDYPGPIEMHRMTANIQTSIKR